MLRHISKTNRLGDREKKLEDRKRESGSFNLSTHNTMTTRKITPQAMVHLVPHRKYNLNLYIWLKYQGNTNRIMFVQAFIFHMCRLGICRVAK